MAPGVANAVAPRVANAVAPKRYYAVRELVEQGRLKCHWIDGSNNPADLGTKLLTGPITRKHSAHMLGHRLMKGQTNPFCCRYCVFVVMYY